MDDPQNHVAVALLRPAHRADPVDPDLVQPDGALAVLVGIGLDGHRAEREGGADRIEGSFGDGDADHYKLRMMTTATDGGA